MSIAVSHNAINWNIVNKNLSPGLNVKEKLVRKIAGLGKHLVHFPPETLYLQVMLEKQAKKETYTVKLTLRLPSNILHAEKSEDDLLHAIDAATTALESEVKSLKAALRGDYRWKRPAWRARRSTEEALLFAEPMEAGAGPQSRTYFVNASMGDPKNVGAAHDIRTVSSAEASNKILACR